ncbi:ABC transporter substrate-binding protein [Limobrevibacterium gyesilva]|uniref:ABC transporter substrate-binding protein n=1 Tax=Limobrevibacterium gyesilva TaxID=2991712 RepID=A0AA41YPM6_9PROT|nr:ABC transporter substrate-binding protein [Limobrevibacterium gyesilva]MCW3475933.1 ABC transporter substrate-binding protein [Limobrevibacterium gyesilva]
MRRATLLASVLLLAGMLPAAAQNLTVTWGEDDNSARTYDPRVTQSRHETQIIVNVFDTLIASDEDSKLHPGLATSWDVAEDGRSITLKLRQGVTFHDGTPFDAEAVKFTFDSIVDPKLGSQGAVDILGPYASTDILGPYEVRINYKRPFGAAAPNLSQAELSMVSPAAVKKLGDAAFAAAPVGTGPFRFVSWERGRQVVLERNDAYNWAPEFMRRKGPSQVARVVNRFIPDASTRVAALESGEIDMSDLTPILDLQRLQANPKYKVMVGEATGLPFGLMLNTSHGILQDPNVRKAFIMGIDRAGLSDDLFFGLVKPVYGPLSKATPAYWPGVEKYYPYDPKKAAALLDEAGWKPGPDGVRVKNGQRLTAMYQPAAPLEPDTAVAVQAELKRIGFDIRIEIITFAKREDLIMNNQDEIQPLRWISGDPSCLEVMFHSRNIPAPGFGKFNYAHLNDKELDSLLERAAGAANPAQRDTLYGEAQKRIMDSAVWVPLHEQVNTVAYRADKTGYRWARTRWNMKFYDVEVAR